MNIGKINIGVGMGFWLFWIVVLLIALFSFTFCRDAQGDTLHVAATVGDTWMNNHDGTKWYNARNSATCDAVFDNNAQTRSGAWNVGDTDWYDRRGFMPFPTHGLPVSPTITACTLFIYIHSSDFIDDDAGGNSVHHIVEAYFASSPATTSDFELGVDIGTNSGGSRNFGPEVVGNWFGIKLDSTQWLADDDSTYLVLISDPTLSDDSLGNGVSEAIAFRQADDPGIGPYLKIHYIGEAVEGQVIIINFGD